MCIDIEVVDKIDEIPVKFNLAAIWFWDVYFLCSISSQTHSNNSLSESKRATY